MNLARVAENERWLQRLMTAGLVALAAALIVMGLVLYV